MISIYREPRQGEFFVVAVDGAQGGGDNNVAQCLSKDRADVAIVASSPDVSANFTPIVHSLLEWIFDKTGVKPVVSWEREAGGISELERLNQLNRSGKYTIYQSKQEGTVDGIQDTNKLGWSTNAQTRPKMLGDLKQAVDGKLVRVYDKTTVEEMNKFIVGKRGRAEAASNAHDDHVMSLAQAWQLYQTETPPPTGNAKVFVPSFFR